MEYTEAVYKLIKDDDNVLDVGGATEAFLRANSVIDVVPYAASKSHTSFKGCAQQFSEETWVQQDICDSSKPWPFKDKEFDFVVAGHVFEDVRDPVYAMSEMIRVSKKGYVEVPSRFMEQVMGLEFPGVCGFAHHRWHIDVVDNSIKCIFKSHEVHSNPEFHIEKRGGWPHLNKKFGTLGFFWEGDVKVFEEISIDLNSIRNYHRETVVIARDNIPESRLYDTKESTPAEVNNPFKDDGMPHISLIFDHTGKETPDETEAMSDEDFWGTV